MIPTRLRWGSPWRVAVLLPLLATVGQRAGAQDTLKVLITNRYIVELNLVVGTAYRDGADTLDGTVTLQANGTWRGTVTAKVHFKQMMKGFGITLCPEFEHIGSQQVVLTGQSVSGFDPRLQSVTLQNGAPDGGFLALALQPAGPLTMNSLVCLAEFPDGTSRATRLLPLNDTRWTTPNQPYIIGLPQAGLLLYRDQDHTLMSNPTSSVQLPITAFSRWTIRVDRR